MSVRAEGTKLGAATIHPTCMKTGAETEMVWLLQRRHGAKDGTGEYLQHAVLTGREKGGTICQYSTTSPDTSSNTLLQQPPRDGH